MLHFCALNVFVFDPIFLLLFKTGMWGVAAATYLAELVPMFFVLFALFNHKFSVKPTFGMFFRKPNKHSWKALKVSVGQLIAQLMTTLPALFILKLVSAGTHGDEELFEDTMASWNVYQRVYQICVAICLGVNQGYLPAASFAVGRKDSARVAKLTAVAALLGSGWNVVCMCVVEPGAEFVAKVFGSDERFVRICAKMLRYGFALIATVQFQILLTAVLQALKLVSLSLATSVGIFMVPVPVFALVMFFAISQEPTNLMLVYPAKDVWALGMMTFVVLWKLRWMFPAMCGKTEDEKVGLMEDLDPEIVNRI